MKNNDMQHFSHQHILTPLQSDGKQTMICHGCKKPTTKEAFYGCLDCKFYLHEFCFDAPPSMVHPSHPSHPLTLHPNPTYSNGSYCCDACGLISKAFSFGCTQCEFDLHLACATFPQTLFLQELHLHKLELVYEAEKTTKIACYVCDAKSDGGCWLYYCGARTCGVGVHISCLSLSRIRKNGKWESKVSINESLWSRCKKQQHYARLRVVKKWKDTRTMSDFA